MVQSSRGADPSGEGHGYGSHAPTGSTAGSSHSAGGSSPDTGGITGFFSGLFGVRQAVDSRKTVNTAVTKTPTNYVTRYPQWSKYTAIASKVSGVDASFFDRLIGIESKGDPKAKSPTGALGLYQFTQKTGKQYGLKTAADRMDPYKSSVAVGKLTRDNVAGLTRALGRTPTQGEAYLAHQQGLGKKGSGNKSGAIGLLTRPNELARNVTTYGNINVNLPAGKSRNISAGDFAYGWTKQFNGNQSLYGNSGNAGGTATAGGAVTQPMGPNYSPNAVNIDHGFWGMILGTNDPVEQSDYLDSIRSGTIGIDPSEHIGLDSMITGSTGLSVLSGGAGNDVLSQSSGHVGAKAATNGEGVNLNDVLGHVISGDIKGAVSSLGGSLFKASGTQALDILNPFGAVADFLGLPGGNAATVDAVAGSSTLAEVIQEYFLRIVVIILGLIFVAVGLALFKNVQTVVTQAAKVVR